MKSQSIFHLSLTFFLGICLSFSSAGKSALLDSLLVHFEKVNEDSAGLKARIASDIAWEYLYLNPDSTKLFSQYSLDYAKLAKDPYSIATAHGSFGLYYDVTGDYDASIESYLEAIKILENYPQYELGLNANYHNLSLIFMNIEDWPKAIYYAKKALQYDIDHNKYQGQVYAYMNIGTMYGNANDMDSSLYFHRKAISVGKKHGELDYIIDYVNMADIELDRKNYDSARFYLDEYIRYSRNAPSSRKLNRLAHGLVGQTRLYIETKEAEKAKIAADSAALIIDQLQSPKLKVKLLAYYSNYYALIGDYKQALSYYQEKENLKDSIIRLELREKIEIVEARYQKEKQENEIYQLKVNSEIGELEMAKTEGQRILFLIIAILAIITLLILSFFFINSRKNSTRLKSKNAIIENLIRESHHRIKNNLQVVSSLLNMQSNTVENKDAQMAIREAQHRVKTIALLHQRLQGSQDFETIQLDEFLIKLSESVILGMLGKEVKVEKNFGLEKIKVETDRAIAIGLLVNELITNSIKYASKKGEILNIKLNLKNQEQLFLEYADNGPGLPEGMDITESKSLGFTIIQSIAGQLNASLEISSTNGFKAEIKIPNEY